MLYIEVLDNHPPPRRVNTISCLLNKLFLQKGYIQGYPRPSSCVVFFFCKGRDGPNEKAAHPIPARSETVSSQQSYVLIQAYHLGKVLHSSV